MKILVFLLALLSCVGCQPGTPAQSGSVVPAKKSMAERLSSTDVAERRTAVIELGESNDPDAVPKLLVALDDPDGPVRSYAVKSLRDRKDGRAVQRLCRLLEEALPSNSPIASEVIAALGSIGSPNAIPTLTAALESDVVFTRYDAAYALGQIGDPSAIPALEKLVSDTERPHSKDKLSTVGEQAQRAIDMIRSK